MKIENSQTVSFKWAPCILILNRLMKYNNPNILSQFSWSQDFLLESFFVN